MIVISELPTPSELYDCATKLPDSWREIIRVGAYHQNNKLLMLPTVGIGICFLFPASDWHRITLMTYSAVPRPGELAPYRRFWPPERVTHLEDSAGLVYEVTVKDEWESPEAYEDKFPMPLEEPFDYSDDEGWQRLKEAIAEGRL